MFRAVKVAICQAESSNRTLLFWRFYLDSDLMRNRHTRNTDVNRISQEEGMSAVPPEEGCDLHVLDLQLVLET